MKLLSLFLLSILFGENRYAKDDFSPCFTFNSAQQEDTAGKNNLFDTGEVLPLTLSGNIRELLSDRGETVRNHALTLEYPGKDSQVVSLPVSVRTRGHFRKMDENCIYPPLLLQFSAGEPVASSVFRNHKKLKLVMPCMGDELVIREWMVYRLYQLITPKSLKARLVTVHLNESKKKSGKAPVYGILLEEEQQMAKRNGAVVVNTKLLKPEQTERTSFLTMAVFQYLIGNTDWSVQFLQNIKLIADGPNAIPTVVAYDFDHAGLVNAPYAQPAEALQMASVRERRYRGFCLTNMQEYTEVVSLFNGLKEAIYSLYSSCPLLDSKYKKATLKYFDEFYEVINDSKLLQKQFGYPCNKNGTGNIVIKGLQKD